MFVKLLKFTFFCKRNTFIYLFNQLNYAERYYDIESFDFFKLLKKEAQHIDEILHQLHYIFDVDKEELKNDFIEFIQDLQSDGFVLTGNSIKEINNKEPKFSYKKIEDLKKLHSRATLSVPETNNFDLIKTKLDELYIENLYLEITRQCNEKCLHCYIPQNERSNGYFIKLKDAKKYIDQAKELGVWQITITGGEPFLHPQINEILKYARKNDVIIVILSNLTVLNTSHIDVLKEIYPSHIQVSLYSLNPKIHDAVTGVLGSQQKTIRAIEKCYANDIPLQVNCPIIKINKNDYREVVNWVRAKGMKAITDFNIMAQTDFELSNMENILPFENAKTVFKEMVQEDNSMLRSYQNMQSYAPDSNKHVCGAAYNTLYISSKGKVYPCANWQSLELGDLNKERLKEVYYNSKKTKEVRNIKFQTYSNNLKADLVPFVKICPSHFSNSNNGDFTKIPIDTIENARIKKEAIEELINKKKHE